MIEQKKPDNLLPFNEICLPDPKQKSILRDSFGLESFSRTYLAIKSGNKTVLSNIISEIAGFTPGLDNEWQFNLKTLDRILAIKEGSKSKVESTFAFILRVLLKNSQAFPECKIYSLHESSIKGFSNGDYEKILQSASKALETKKNLKHVTIVQDLINFKSHSPTAQDDTPLSKELSASCLILPHVDPFGGKPIIPKLEKYFTKEITSAQKIEKKRISQPGTERNALANLPSMVTKINANLQEEVFSKEVNDNFIKTKFSRLNNKLEEYANEIRNIEDVHASLKKHQQMHSMKIRLIKEKHECHDELLILQREIETQLNRPLDNLEQQHLKEILIAGEANSPIYMKEALRLFFQQDSHPFQLRNSALSAKDVEKINILIRSFLEIATHQQQVDKVIEKLEKLIILEVTMLPETDRQKTIGELVHLSSQRRMYSTAEHPEYLLFEYQQGILLKESQVELLDRLKIKSGKIGSPQYLGVVAEAIPGLGKTFAGVPIQALLNADGESISIVMIPESLIESMNPQIRNSLQTTSGNLLESLHITRASNTDDNLKIIKARINRVRDERRVLSMSPSSTYSLYLNFIELFERQYEPTQIEKESLKNTYADDCLTSVKTLGENILNYFFPEESEFDSSAIKVTERHVSNQINIFSNLLNLFKQAGKVIIDEVDSVLDIMKSFHFTMGAKRFLEKNYRDTTASTFLYLATNEEIGRKVALGFGLHQGNQGLTENYFHQEIKPLLAYALLTDKIKDKDEGFQAFIKQLTYDERKILKNFLNGNNVLEGRKFLLVKASEDIQDRFAIYFEQFNVLLPLILPKNLQEHYGRDPKNPDCEIAIPYQQSTASLGSTFGTELETVFYTVKMHLQNGLSESLVEREVRRISEALLVYLKKHPGKIPEETSFYQAYLNLTSGKDVANIFKPTSEDIKKITLLVNKRPDIQLTLIDKYILKEIMVFPSQLNAYPSVMGMVFHSIQGMSGTLWNAETFTTLIEQLYESKTSAEILQLIWRDKSPITELKLPSTAIKINEMGEILRQTYSRKGFIPGSFIDTAALFRGIDNVDVAREILLLDCWKGTKIKGVIFYDQQDGLKVIKFINEIITIFGLEDCGLNRDELVAFWDQKHTTGSDLKVAENGSATLSFGKNTILRDLEQSALRMRDLAKNQRINIVIFNEDARVIRAKFNQWSGEKVDELKLEHLLYYAISLQAERQSKENFSALKQKMNAILLEKVYAVLIDPEISLETKLSTYASTRSLFVDTIRERPFELYAQPITKEEKAEVLKITKENFLKSPAMLAFKQDSELLKRFNEAEILKELNKLVESGIRQLADKISISSNPYGKEKVVQVEKQKESQKELQKEAEKETEKEIMKFVANYQFAHLNRLNWPLTGFFGKDYFNDKASSVNKILSEANILDADLIDKNLLGTKNLFPIFNEDYLQELNKRLGFYQKEHQYILAIQDKITLKWRVVLLDDNDAVQFKSFLIQDAQNPNTQETRDITCCLYHLDAKTQHSSSESIPNEKFENDPELLRLLIQAKFLAGRSSYSKSELPLLKDWIKKDPKQLYELFMQVIKFKEVSRMQFEDSELDRLFKGK
jgi:hypothetical protein